MKTDSKVTRKRLRLGGVAAAVLLAAVVLQGQASQASQETSAVEEAFESALVLEQSLDAVYPGEPRRPTETLELRNLGGKASLAKLPDATTLSRNDRAAEEKLAEIFAGDQLTFEATHMKNAVAGRSAANYTYSGGAEDFQYSSITVEGNVAKVSASVRTWTTYVHQGNGYMDISSPSNVILVDAALELQDERWKVTQINWEFAPGEAP